MIPAVTSEQMAQVDEILPEEYGITVSRMMENAGYQIADFIRKNFAADRKVVVYAGKGNNGGDGLSAARRLHNWGWKVEIVLASEELDGIRKEELDILEELDVPISKNPVDSDVAVDALIGYNLEGEPRPPFDSMIETINQSEKIVSVDVPSGMDADTGEEVGISVKPDHVVTLGMPKKGLKDLDSEVWIADISIPGKVYERFGLEVGSIFDKNSIIRWRK